VEQEEWVGDAVNEIAVDRLITIVIYGALAWVVFWSAQRRG
jgi:hypothetical protein